MTGLSKRLEQIIRKELSTTIIPVKVSEGILVGDVLITSQDHLKNIYRNDRLLYKEIHLNSIAIKIANMLALKKSTITIEELYKADQDYGKWFTDSQVLRTQYQKSINNKDFERADYLWAKYQESRDKTMSYKKRAERLATS